ncbi:MAG: signal peptidase I [Treponema sp.]|nr:signal peptidase I [Treponema sp.]
MEKLRRLIVINLFLSTFFTLLCIPFHFDVSVAALPVSAAFTFLLYEFSFKKLFKESSPSVIGMVRRFFQYEPFVFITSFVLLRAGNFDVYLVLDIISAVVWTVLTVFSFVILFYLSEKRVWKLSENWKLYHESHPSVKPGGAARIGIEILEWVDALIQAVFTIVLINIFLFQLYEIPSESMVPEFLVKDRVVVFKTLAGPKFPLSRAGLPYIESYDRGDIVVFRNPHYSNDRKSEVKTFMSQFVYMCTLTLVNINTDDRGEIKADPLVKRVTGLPGEQIMLVDGELYARKDGTRFSAVGDSSYACWNAAADRKLYDLDKSILKIEKLPMSGITREDIFDKKRITLSDALQIENSLVEMTEEVERLRRNLDLESAKLECMSLSAEFSRYASGGNVKGDVSSVIDSSALLMNNFFDNSFLSSLVIKLRQVDGGKEWFDAYMNSWHKNFTNLNEYRELDDNGELILEGPALAGSNLYTDSLLRLDVMMKLTTGRIMLARLNGNVSVLTENISVLEKLCNYILFMDQRNMGLFPANNGSERKYIPEDCYFMMGDNRYNSLDMRHSYEHTEKPLSEFDEYSIRYMSNLEPQYVHRSRILGKASFRFWPINRIGFPGSSLRK